MVFILLAKTIIVTCIFITSGSGKFHVDDLPLDLRTTFHYTVVLYLKKKTDPHNALLKIRYN